MNCVVYKNNDEYSGSKEISGTTCGGVSGFFYLNYGDSICMDIDRPIILCDYFSIEGPCNPPVTPSNTPSQTNTPSVTATQTNTPSITSSQTMTPTPSVTIGITPTMTPSVTTTLTPTKTNTPSITSTQTNTPTNTQTTTPTNTVTPTQLACNRIYIEFNQSGYTNQYYSYSPQSPAYISTGGTPYFEYSCSTYNSNSYVVFTGETTGHSLIYSPFNNAFVLWGLDSHGPVNDCGEGRSSLITNAVFNTGFTYNGMVYPANGGSNNLLANLSYVGTCNNAPTPTPTRTPTNTPTITKTPTNTPTPSITPSPVSECISYVVVNTQPSLDIPIYDVYVNGIQVTYSSGANWTITPSNSPGTFTTTQTGSTQTVLVYYGANIPGQRIEILDCNEVTQCQSISPGGGIATFTNVAVSCGCYWSINGYDGSSCP